ncbi:MAG TPA: carboxypeptidase regulatory-like domain-containing protein [Gemmatimonadaceae bacterium]|nr:carboxypeptidase regulatory-like domain-containing protein [Gemmatimonadaceae bacterium]
MAGRWEFGAAARRLAMALLAAAPGVVGERAEAQQADVIRGRITTRDDQAIQGASVRATSIPGNVTRTATTDRTGRFTITFPAGEGDYWITVSAVGFAPRRFELKRVADEDVLLADLRLEPSGVVLDEVTVRADRARPPRNDNTADLSGTEKSLGSNAVDPSQAGNLAQMAASLPGVQLIPGADGNPDQFSVFGLGGDQNRSTLNGLAFGGTELPRDATMRSVLATSPWDVSRGGFSGAQLAMRTQSGSNFSARGMSSLFTTPGMAWTDRAGRALGAEYTALSVGGAATGPITLDQSFYSAGWQLDRRLSDLSNLMTADPVALRIAGVAPDSVARLRGILGQAGVPLGTSRAPGMRIGDRGLFIASADFAPPAATSGASLNLSAIGSFNHTNAPFAQVTALPTVDASRTNWFGALQGRHTNYFDSGVLSETAFGVSYVRSYTSPYLELPAGRVRVSSVLDDGSAGLTGLSFGGSEIQSTTNRSAILGGQNQLSWISLDNRHRLKLSTELRWEFFDQELLANRLGTFTYNSLADLEAGMPASYSRLLAAGPRRGSQLIAGLSLGDSYRPRPDLQFQYGVRLDANRFLARPDANPALRQALGVVNDEVPSRIHLSPRAGFSWTYGRAPQLAAASGFVRGPRAVVRGGIGIFQNVPNAQLIAGAISGTGLTDARQQLTCVGAAVPLPGWSGYLADPASIPRACADGTVFASLAPDATLFAPAFAAPRSLRANLNWTGALAGSRFLSTVDATWSRNRQQPGFVDLNVAPAARFSLDDEAGRPVYVQPGSIVPSTGAIAVQDGRVTPEFSRVMQMRSDLASVTRQLTVSLQPLTFSTRFAWNVTYVWSGMRDAANGFMSTAGDPRVRERARAALDARHQFVYSLSYNFFDWVPVTWSGSFRSGLPFTPLVAGDVNGDGYLNDRAFVFDPAAPGVDPDVAAGLQSLLRAGSSAARACLTRQLGALAERSSCEGPWTSTSTLIVALNPVKFRLPQRLNLALYVNNALGAADLLLHGERGRRGWGQTVVPDPSLLFVRGFDPVARRFRYEVNPRFGATSPEQTLSRNPVVVTLQARVDIGLPRERQLLTQSLDRGRARPGTRSSDQELRAMSGALIPPNPMALILLQADSLRLTRVQADSIATLNRRYALAYDSIWTPVAQYLAALPDEYDRDEAYQRYRRAREASIDVLRSLVPAARGLLTAEQRRMLPAMIMSALDTRYLASVRSSTAGGTNMGVMGMLAQMGWMGGSVDPSGTAVMIHR